MGLDEKIKKSDLDYAVEEIKIKGKSFWPFFKVFFFDAQYVKGGTQTSFSLIEKIKFVFSLFYGWTNWFGKTDYLVFSNSDQRKLIDGKYIDKSADFLQAILPNVLHIELPVFTHFPINQLKFKNVVSHLPLRILETLYAKLALRSTTMDGQNVVDSLNRDFGIQVEALSFGKRFYAQYWMMKMLLAWKKPKAIFIVVSYMKMGYILAAKEQNVEVIEMQHGTINKSHFGYCNYKMIDSNLFPNYLLSYGKGTKDVFTDGNITIDVKNVYSVGHYYLHLIQESNMAINENVKRVAEAKVSVAVSLQDDSIGKQMAPFIKELAEKRPDWLFVFAPRKTAQSDYEKMKLPTNVVFLPTLNIYEIISLCKIHSTVFSTCALEAPTLGKPNVLVNIENKSKEYFSTLLPDRSVTRMVDSVEEYILEIEKDNFPNKETIQKSNANIIDPDFDENLNHVLREINI